MSFKIGYLFKPTHHDIHYVKKGASLDLRRRYEKNFSRDIDDAKLIKEEEKAMEVIVDLVARFKPTYDYNPTPVLVYPETNTYKMFTFGQWSKPVFKIS
ncbi:hypothetical protein [Pseudoalteromonas sp.]|jgi:hypothetical protein|uniref:hypothetical protein n=1 Tax=Pseudoalteromonas sp. TaxID=53249 RepID=UPI0026027D02|nr:hypothetical protein [Pseudoalteromonas sp.]MCP3862181.1 hypothetical protein [Aestuariibacter sp.]MCP4585574.1 hypothetical protein [Pseudoalteromonas sp.]|tara:strand:+ start:200 stop:496 length:297 start_codon:yes stop_codon:yes gene_type:complete